MGVSTALKYHPFGGWAPGRETADLPFMMLAGARSLPGKRPSLVLADLTICSEHVEILCLDGTDA